MRTKLLLLITLCAFQCGFTAFAMENIQVPQPVLQYEAAQAELADDDFALFQQKGIALACLCHPRCTANSPQIAANCVELIGKYLKEACKIRCQEVGCNFGTFDNDVLAAHMEEHYKAPTPYSHNHSLTPQQWDLAKWDLAIGRIPLPDIFTDSMS